MSKRLGESLSAARRARHLSQGELARRLGVSQQAVSSLESRVSNLHRAIAYARAVGAELRVSIGGREVTLSHAMDPDERAAIEANLDWFTGLMPEQRLAVIAQHSRAAEELRGAGRDAIPGDADRGSASDVEDERSGA